MKILRLTPAQQGFVEIEIIGRFELDDLDPKVVRLVEIMEPVFNEKGHLAVPDPQWLYEQLLDISNTIDNAIEAGETEHMGYGNRREARNLQKSADAISDKLHKVPGWWGYRR
jgi:hypothetical protein